MDLQQMHRASVSGTMSMAAKGQKGSTQMQRSAEVRDTLLRFYEVFSAADLEGVAQNAQQAEGVVAIGTAGEWIEGREQ
jgi:hypothetical protein